ncbi:hypothetical protein AAF712_007631 [Marasmius tenuissimus]|uniref:Uncharacterized protein n=1 Tax=Marasmius tenuissimus TaxID=585030 RepID=A0ABR2ZWJ9_9AGAR
MAVCRQVEGSLDPLGSTSARDSSSVPALTNRPTHPASGAPARDAIEEQIAASNTPCLDFVTRLHKRKEGLEAWLDRSGSLPITVSLTAQTYPLESPPWGTPPVPSAESRALTTEFIELLAQYSHRWRTVVFNHGVHLLDLTPLERLTSSSLSSLESFHSFGALLNRHGQEAHANVDHNLLPPSPLENLLTKAQSLRRLEIFNANISAATLSLPISWQRLIKLSIILPILPIRNESSIYPGELMQVLAAQCHSLDTLNITLGGGSWRTGSGGTISHPAQWPSLRSLRVVFLDMPLSAEFPGPNIDTNTSNDMTSSYSTFLPAVIQIFDSVTLPSLKKLSVAFYGGEPFGGYYAARLPFEDLLARSQCPLTHFEMFYPRIVAADAVIRVLRQLETLVSVNLGYGRLTGKERKQSFGPGYFMEPPEPWSDPNVSSPWARNWLDRILQEFLVAGSKLDIEPPVDVFAAMPLCPRLEELNIGGCALDDRDRLLDFATKTRRASLRTFRVDLGRPARDDTWKIFESLQVQSQDSERMRVVRDVGGVMLDWRWDVELSRNPNLVSDDATTGLPHEGSWWNESLWL